ncbi:MAG: OsmC family protein [Thermoleophilia bacterium]
MTEFATTMPVRLDPESRRLDRLVDLPPDGRTIVFGAHGPVAEHYGMPGEGGLPTTLDYLTASVAGCLIGTFGGSLRRAGVRIKPADLTAVATGDVASDEDNVLRLRRITLDYTLRIPEEHAETAAEVHAVHASKCPNARSVSDAIEIVTNLTVAAPAAA